MREVGRRQGGGRAGAGYGRIGVSAELTAVLENLYRCFDFREWVPPDPLQFLYGYPDPADMEIVALLCSCLAYGRVAQIVGNLRKILGLLGAHPSRLLRETSRDRLLSMLGRAGHRFARGTDIALLLWGASHLQRDHESLGNALSCYGSSEGLLGGLERLVEELLARSGLGRNHLLPRPSGGSACKRLMLLTRWMVRHDRVDPGGWGHLGRENLIVPLDTHMYHAGRALGFTDRRSRDLRTAQEVTEGFARIRPDDPVRYDFALTRFGIRKELDRDELIGMLREYCSGDGAGSRPAETGRGHRA
ncbi:TIGR02757 family protein [Candidatus Fermentibacteria bacterium]|nr:TIGR02757 family protein [Candidatus Fermentibacteria bacterium]